MKYGTIILCKVNANILGNISVLVGFLGGTLDSVSTTFNLLNVSVRPANPGIGRNAAQSGEISYAASAYREVQDIIDYPRWSPTSIL